LTLLAIIIGAIFTFVKTLKFGYWWLTGFALVLVITLLGILYMLLVIVSKVHSKCLHLKVVSTKSLCGATGNGKRARIMMNCFSVYGIKVGNFFVVKKHTPLLVLDVLSSTTASVLLSFEI